MTSKNTARDMCSGDESLVPGVLRGFRSWDMEVYGNPCRISETGLFAMSVSIGWTREMEAKCLPKGCPCEKCSRGFFGTTPKRGERHAGIPAPYKPCECGIYGWYHPDMIVRDHWMPRAGAVGVIDAYGRIVMGQHGFRAEKARIRAVTMVTTDHWGEGDDFYTMHAAMTHWDNIVAPRLEKCGIEIYPDIQSLVSDYPPEDVSGLIGPQEML